LLSAFAGGQAERAVDGLGEHWELAAISMRRWPAASSLQSTVECVLELVDHHRLRPTTVTDLRVFLPPAGYALCADKGWHDQGTALQSARWVTSVVLADGACWLDQFTPQRLADARLGRFARSRVEVVEDPQLPSSGARVVARTRRGAVFEAARDEALGDPGRSLTSDDVFDKLAGAAASTADAERAMDIRNLLGGPEWTAAQLCSILGGEGR
jgi:2-methylcitrate dehydratase PrpD